MTSVALPYISARKLHVCMRADRPDNITMVIFLTSYYMHMPIWIHIQADTDSHAGRDEFT